MSGGAWLRARGVAWTSAAACVAAVFAQLACAPAERVGEHEMLVLGFVQPPTWGGQFRGNWLVRVDTQPFGGWAGPPRREEIITDARGRFQCALPKPLGAGALDATIMVVGGPGYRSAHTRILWPAGAQEPRIIYANASDATRASDRRLGALYRIVFEMAGE